MSQEIASTSKEKTLGRIAQVDKGKRTIDCLRLVSDSGVLGVLGACCNYESGRQLFEFVKVTHVGWNEVRTRGRLDNVL
jgi:hypothetical protein